MSYTYVNAFVRATRDSVDWVATDLSSVLLNDILNNYKDVYITLSNPIETGPVYLTREVLQADLPSTIPSPTLSAWLVNIGNAALNTVNAAPNTKTNPVRYADAWQAGYVINRTDSTRSPQSQIPDAAKPDLLLTKSGVDLYAMSEYLLTTVNGFLHPTAGSVNGLYVLGGGRSGVLANNNHVGVLSFLNVGSIQQIPITDDMLYKPDSNLTNRQSVYVKLPVSLKGKTLLMSIGGYLHVLDESYDVVADNVVKINTYRIPLPQRFFQSQNHVDLSSLPLVKGLNNPSQFSLESIYSDDVITKYLTLPQTFAIVVDTPQMYRQVFELERPRFPGRLYSKQGFRFPLMGSRGRMYDYRLSQEEDVFVYGCETMETDRYLFATTDNLTQLSISDGKQGYRRVTPTNGFLLEFGNFS